jgi:hypothetical protein
MQRLVLAVLFIALAAAAVAFAARQVSRLVNGPAVTDAVATGGAMQRISFILLMFLMVYVIMSGAS